MTQRSTDVYTCDGCGVETEAERHHSPYDWRSLAWRGGYVGNEKRKADFCPKCAPIRLAALDVLLNGAGKSTEK